MLLFIHLFIKESVFFYWLQWIKYFIRLECVYVCAYPHYVLHCIWAAYLLMENMQSLISFIIVNWEKAARQLILHQKWQQLILHYNTTCIFTHSFNCFDITSEPCFDEFSNNIISCFLIITISGSHISCVKLTLINLIKHILFHYLLWHKGSQQIHLILKKCYIFIRIVRFSRWWDAIHIARSY